MQKMSKKLFILLLLVVSVVFVFAACEEGTVIYTFVDGENQTIVTGIVGDPLTVPTSSTPEEGYYFVGWFDGTEQPGRNFGNQNRTFEARYAKYVVITFIDGQTTTPQYYRAGETIVPPTPVGATGAIFVGWFDANNNPMPATATVDATYTAAYDTAIVLTLVNGTQIFTVSGNPGEVVHYPNIFDVTPPRADQSFLGWYNENGERAPKYFTYRGTYTAKFGGQTYNDAVTTLAANWNQHIYQTSDDSYPHDFIVTGLFGFYFNDTYNGYEIEPQMATGLTDVSAEYYADDPAKQEAYAYRIALNPNAVWQNGDPINAYTYEYSMQQLLDSQMKNYRATDYLDGDLEILNGQAYYNRNSVQQRDGVTDYTLPVTEYYFDAEAECYFFGASLSVAYNHTNYHEGFMVDGVDVYQEYILKGVHMTEELIPVFRALAANFGDTNPDAWYEFVFYDYVWGDCSWDEVGFKVIDEYTFDLILARPLTGFYLYYNLSGNWIVHESTYEACKVWEGGTYNSSYCTSVETTMSYGPYVMSYFQSGKQMEFVKNENWFGYDDDLNYGLYNATRVVCQVVEEVATRKNMFLAGQLETWGLGAEDYAEYRSSRYAHTTPADSLFFMILTGHIQGLTERQAEAGDGVNKIMIADPTFRAAMAVAFDKEDFASTVSPARSGGYGLIGITYVWDVESGENYRNTEQAKLALCEYYSVDTTLYPTLDAAVNSITGYNPVMARELFIQAFEAGIADGRIKAGDVVRIEYASSTAGGSFVARILNYLNEQLKTILEGTGYAIEFYESGSYGTEWSTKLREGASDSCLAGWTGSRMNPYSLTNLYVNPDRAYDARWQNSSGVMLEITLDVAKEGEAEDMRTLNLSLADWDRVLNGSDVTFEGVTYNFGYGMVKNVTRLNILAKFEVAILNGGSYIPMLQDGSTYLLSMKLTWITDQYNSVLAYGGMTYATFNYTDTEWAAFLQQNGGTLNYTV